jgi:hypothetical protein
LDRKRRKHTPARSLAAGEAQIKSMQNKLESSGLKMPPEPEARSSTYMYYVGSVIRTCGEKQPPNKNIFNKIELF